jgi:hypothetical protein
VINQLLFRCVPALTEKIFLILLAKGKFNDKMFLLVILLCSNVIHCVK